MTGAAISTIPTLVFFLIFQRFIIRGRGHGGGSQTDPMSDARGSEGISALDHVHIYVADVDAAADWYGRVLGLEVMPVSKFDKGSRYMATPRGQYCATFFKRKTALGRRSHQRLPGARNNVFLEFGDKLEALQLPNRRGGALQRDDAEDHGLAWSYYFADPDGNHLEITTYDHQKVRDVLGTGA